MSVIILDSEWSETCIDFIKCGFFLMSVYTILGRRYARIFKTSRMAWLYWLKY